MIQASVRATSKTVQARRREVRESFAHLGSVDPVLAKLIDARPDFDPDAWQLELPKMTLFGSLVFQILGQQISVAATRAILGRLTERFDGRIPAPAEVADVSVDELRAIGMSRRKAETIRELAARFADGRLSARRLSHLRDQDVIDELTQIKGIGTWTVHGALLIALHRPDVVPTGDLALRKAVRDAYGLDRLPTEDEFREIAKRWTPYGSLAVGLLFAAASDGWIAGHGRRDDAACDRVRKPQLPWHTLVHTQTVISCATRLR